MGLLNPLEELWRFAKQIPFLIKVASVSSTTAALNSVHDQIGVMADSFAKVRKSPFSASRARDESDIRASVDKMIAFLNGIAWHTHRKIPPLGARGGAVYSLEMAEAALARQELSRIYWLQNDDKLPYTVTWRERRASLASQRDALTRFGIQLEGAIRRTDEEIVNARAAEDAVRKAASDPIITKEELVMLNDDWTNWANTESEAREWKARFTGALQVAKKQIETLSKVIDDGDGRSK